MFDLHTHHERCGHAQGTLRDYVRSAIDAGLHTLGFSDHSPFFAEPEDHHRPWVAMAKSEFPRYVAEAHRLREEYADRIRILIGVESDYFPEHAGLYREVLARHDFDYVIGSVHVMDGVDLFRPERWAGATEDDLLRAKEQYCDLVAQSARSGLFDILGHIDVVKAACPGMSSIATPATERMLRTIAEADVVIEVNTSGRTKACGGWYPDLAVLEMAAHYGVKVTYGSDAHVPERVGEDRAEVRRTLRDLGYRHWYVFEQRRRIALPL
ncbi:histidinol-phosphatase [Streptomyces sp. MBT27]|uniref:histidinol-phosphatase n=1 Tax=Streptomyces sp. MBT27 TaxID=1488356 RepID=UPI00141EDF90|nr:histidinol-phosphatase [Streptomyces sp. MBT27]